MASNIENESPFIVLIVARHGERHDYVTRDSGGNWTKSAARPWDPPLTDPHGLQQARTLGKHVVAELKRLQLPPLSQLYSSPLLRCRQTAAWARKGMLEAETAEGVASNDSSSPSTPSLIQVEIALVETICEKWYRSWSLLDSNGTWGFKPPNETTLGTLRPQASQPVQRILEDWKASWAEQRPKDEVLMANTDWDYLGKSKLGGAYTFPDNIEPEEEQRRRLREFINTAAAKVPSQSTSLAFFSHGAPVTFLFEELTGRGRKDHGASSYCCYSMYRIERKSLHEALEKGEKPVWEALQINQADFLHEKIVREEHID